jgi:predicted ATPase
MNRLGRYELLQTLGRGGNGQVHSAVLHGPAGFRKAVAVKVLHGGGAGVTREARLGGLLRHPHLVEVYDIGETGGTWYCAMELMAGSLADHVPLPPRAVVDVGMQVCDALAYAHDELGMVHLDLKPENLLHDGAVVKVADLGLARAEGFEGSGVRGTPGYMSPEQARGDQVDARSDVFAVGVVLAVLATGNRPDHTGPTSTMTASGPAAMRPFGVPDIEDFACPPWLDGVVRACIAPDPRARFASTRALRDALDAVDVEGESLADVLTALTPPRPTPVATAADPLTEPGPLVGRHEEVQQALRELTPGRAVALVGLGGIGKSRVALAVARQARRQLAVWWVDAAGVTTEAELLRPLADALEVRAAESLAQVGHALRARGHGVMVVDDLTRAAAAALLPLVAACPTVRWLFTAREPTGTAGETVIPIGPLAPGYATALLADLSGFDPGEVRALASKLDGIPLALELAAGRLAVLSPPQLAARLDRRLTMLRGKGRTLRAALDASWSLLAEGERVAAAQLSVFAGAFDVEAADAVLALPADSPWSVDVLDALVARAILSVRGSRLVMLDTVRDYAAEQLEDRDAAEQRHGSWFGRHGPDMLEDERIIATLRPERADLVMACRRAVARGDAQIAAATGHAAWRLAERGGPFDAAAALAETVLELTRGTRHEGLAALDLGAALCAAGHLVEGSRHLADSVAWSRDRGDDDGLIRALSTSGPPLVKLGRADDATAHLEEAIAMLTPGPLSRTLVRARVNLAHTFLQIGDAERAIPAYRVAIAEADAVGDVRGALLGRAGLAAACTLAIQFDEARALYTRAIEGLTRIGDHRAAAISGMNLANLLAEENRFDEAVEAYRAVLDPLAEAGDRIQEANARANLGITLRDMGQMLEARDLFAQALTAYREAGHTMGVGNTLGLLGTSLRREGRFSEAMALLEEAADVQRATHDKLGEASTLFQLGLACSEAGRADRALVALRRSQDVCREIGDRRLAAAAMSAEGELQASQGDAELASALYAAAHAVFEAMGDDRRASVLRQLQGDMALIDAPHEALRLYTDALDAIRQLPEFAVIAEVRLARAMARTGDIDGARALLDRDLAATTDHVAGREAALVYLALAELAWATHDGSGAHVALDRAEETARAKGTLPMVARDLDRTRARMT